MLNLELLVYAVRYCIPSSDSLC